MIKHRLTQRGFTLIEVSLAIVIGVIVLAGAIALYNQTKLAAGNAKMKEKLLAVSTAFEEYSVRNNGYPTLPNVARTVFKNARPDDYLLSPWGGAVGSDLLPPRAEEGLGFAAQPANAEWGWTDTKAAGGNYQGGIQLFVVSTPGATASMYDKTLSKQVVYRHYSFHGVSPSNDDGYIVFGPNP